MKLSDFSAKLNASYFQIYNYIVGEVMPGVIPMTIGAKGVKHYTALDQANIINVGLNLDARLLSYLKWSGQITYNRGQDKNKNPCPTSVLSLINQR
jgi:iron complex outermembrane receptor protein